MVVVVVIISRMPLSPVLGGTKGGSLHPSCFHPHLLGRVESAAGHPPTSPKQDRREICVPRIESLIQNCALFTNLASDPPQSTKPQPATHQTSSHI